MLPIVLVANVINGTLTAVVFARTNAAALVAAWWLSLLLLSGVRGALWLLRRRYPAPRRLWTVVAVAGSAASGALWGAAGYLLFSAGGETQRMVLGFVLGGMGAGAVTALAPSLPAFYLYLFPSVVPFGVQLARQGDTEHLTMATACVLYLVALALLGRRANRWLTESVSRRLENAELVRSLEEHVEERTTELRLVNERLQRDIAERRRAEAALATYGERQAAIADFGRLALSGIDLDRLFEAAVTLVRDRLGVTRAALIQEPFDPGHAMLRAAAGFAPAEPGVGGADAGDHPKAGRDILDPYGLRDAETSAEAVIYQQDRPFGILLAADSSPRAYTDNDVTFLQSIANMLAAAIERKRIENDIQRLALQDPLTGLPNRGLFRSQLRQELARSARSQHMLAVLLLDLDQFKDVNDTLGHPIGDRLLAAVAKRLKACLREADAPARLGGDEFAVILAELRSPEDAAVVARKVVAALAEPFRLDGHELHIGGSVGITVSPCDGSDVDGLLRNADLALYRAKAEGRNTFRFYTAEMASRVAARKALEQDLRQALDGDELCLAYQPQFHLTTRLPIGAEALLRWQHPRRGLLLPNEFLPVAELTGLAVPLARWVLRQVTEQMLAWRDEGLPAIRIATNISPSQCRRGDLVATIEEIARRTGGALPWLELEVTEHLFLPPDGGDSLDVLRRVHELGATVCIDDFGTGSSSLRRLKGGPVDGVKIDRSFVAEIGGSRDTETIVRAIIALARSLGMTVTAEGVETERQLQFLDAEGCDIAQGNLLSRPLPPDQFATLLRAAAGPPPRLGAGGTA